MPFTWREAVIGAAALFFLFLIVKMRPVSTLRDKLGGDVRAARDRAHAATTPHERVAALLDAAELAARARRWTASSGFFLRAMFADPTSNEPLDRAIAALKRRPQMLEKILWRRLASLPWDEAHRPATRSAAVGLAHLYRHALRDQARAEVLQRLARTWKTQPSLPPADT